MSRLALQDHIVEILNFVADDLDTPQTAQEQTAKSKGQEVDDSPLAQSAAEVHASLRLADGFDIDQMVSEYRALRASVVKRWVARNQALAATDLHDLTRFNEAIDQALAESVAHYTKTINNSRNLFLGVLGHDLRNPIGAATMAAQMMVRMGAPEARQTMLASQIVSTTERATRILNDLLEITRTAFGTDVPIVREHLDMAEVAERLVDEMRALSGDRRIDLDTIGETDGEWDGARIGQVFSNLIGNALQYSAPDSAIVVTVADEGDRVRIAVHNDGDPIAPETIDAIFDPMTRGHVGQDRKPHPTNLGLGLFIAKIIVTAHGGEIGVESTADAGTTFTVLLPKRKSAGRAA